MRQPPLAALSPRQLHLCFAAMLQGTCPPYVINYSSSNCGILDFFQCLAKQRGFNLQGSTQKNVPMWYSHGCIGGTTGPNAAMMASPWCGKLLQAPIMPIGYQLPWQLSMCTWQMKLSEVSSGSTKHEGIIALLQGKWRTTVSSCMLICSQQAQPV